MSSSNTCGAPTPGCRVATHGDAIFLLPLLTCATVLIHGYHLGVDDAAIYIPAIKKVADPSLYPFGAEFFQSHAHLSLFPDLIGNTARLTHAPVDLVIFAWHVASIFLLLLASWRLACVCFKSSRARWGGVALIAALLSVPVAGTALSIMDPYLTARSLSTPAVLFAIGAYLSNRRKQAVFWLLVTAAVHPQMSLYGAVFLGCLALVDSVRAPEMLYLSGVPFLFDFQPARGPAREVLFSRTFFFLSTWTWYEWVGVFAPLALLWWFSSRPMRGTTPSFHTVSRTLVPFGIMFTAAGILLSFSARLENYTRLQPMRAFHLLYVVFFVLLGGLVGEYVLQSRTWRWLALFLPLAAGMWLVQRQTYPASSHIEWPGSAYRNPWTSAFLWIRGNTPRNAVFAMDPKYMLQPGEDTHGFRAIAERSVLADYAKDSGAVSLFPQLAGEWKNEVDAQTGWDSFGLQDFQNLARRYPVTWILTRRPGPAGLTCPFENRDFAVCRMEAVIIGQR
jgi:hypothetical protein